VPAYAGCPGKEAIKRICLTIKPMSDETVSVNWNR